MSLSRTVFGSKFQMAGAVQRNSPGTETLNFSEPYDGMNCPTDITRLIHDKHAPDYQKQQREKLYPTKGYPLWLLD